MIISIFYSWANRWRKIFEFIVLNELIIVTETFSQENKWRQPIAFPSFRNFILFAFFLWRVATLSSLRLLTCVFYFNIHDIPFILIVCLIQMQFLLFLSQNQQRWQKQMTRNISLFSLFFKLWSWSVWGGK